MPAREDVHLLTLRGASSEDDECVLGEGSQSTGKFENIRAQVDQVFGVMRNNMNKLLEREARLEDLETRSENLNTTCDDFQVTARRTARRMWWRNVKMTMILAGIALLVILVIVIPIVVKSKNSERHGPQ